MKRALLFCVIVFLAVIGVLIWRSDKLLDKKDPSSLPAPTKEFNEWRKHWEHSRF